MIDTLVALLGLKAHDPAFWMPLLFAALLFAVIVSGSVLNGFDIGVGCLSLLAPADLRPRMLALLGPWRDANAYWLFLGMALFYAAFPGAWGAVLGRLYLPLLLLSMGVMLRTVAFELRLRAPGPMQAYWIRAFGVGSLLAAVSQGWLLARVAGAFQADAGSTAFAVFLALCAIAAFSLLGATWLIMREGGALRARAVLWARAALRWTAAGAAGLSLVLAFANAGVYLRWSDSLKWSFIAPVWLFLLLCFVSLDMGLQRMSQASYRWTALPFVLVLLIFLVLLGGLGFSLFPYLIIDEITLWDGAASVDSLRLVLALAVVAFPVAVAFNLRVYWSMLGVSRAPEVPKFRQPWSAGR